MQVTLRHFLVPFAPMLIGGLLIYLGLAQGWGAVWAVGGVFFIIIGVSALTLAFAWATDGPAGAFLRSPFVSIVLVVAVLGSLCVTLYVGALNYIR